MADNNNTSNPAGSPPLPIVIGAGTNPTFITNAPMPSTSPPQLPDTLRKQGSVTNITHHSIAMLEEDDLPKREKDFSKNFGKLNEKLIDRM